MLVRRRLVMRGAWWLVVPLLGCGCAEEALAVAPVAFREEAPPVQQNADLAPPGDTFWLAQAITEMHKPPPVRPRSISLGYVGDAPLSGGVMRDTPISDPSGGAPQQGAPFGQGEAAAQGCSCALGVGDAPAGAFMAR